MPLSKKTASLSHDNYLYRKSDNTNENAKNLEMVIFASIIDETIELKAKLINSEDKETIEQLSKNISVIEGSFITEDIFSDNLEKYLPSLKSIINQRAKKLSEENFLVGKPIQCTIFVDRINEMIGH